MCIGILSMSNVLGNDIRLVIEEVGEPVSIYNYETEKWFSTKIDPERDWQSRRPYENEYEVISSFPHDTEAKPGFVLNILADNTFYLIASMVSEYFEGFAITKESFLYKCNSKFWLQRKERERNKNYELVDEWNNIYEAHHSLFTYPIERQNIRDEDYGRFPEMKKLFIVSKFIDIKTGDKITVDIDPNPWTVELVESTRLTGVHFCQLGAFSG